MMKTISLLPFVAGLSVAAAFAQDPPSRVARLNWISGAVSFQPASLDTWTAATVNYPLTTGDHIYTDGGGRAEIHIGANAIRLNSLTSFGFLNLDDNTVQVRFTDGAMEVRLRSLGDQDVYEIDTPNGAISLLRTGDYRVDTDPDRNATMITVFSGQVEVTANGNSFAVRPRQTAYFSEGSAPDIRGANDPDDFDRFTADRNGREERRPSSQHVPATMVGYEDLDAYGSWRQEPDYGWVWAPPVQAGWVPYHDGHWAWIEPWGWTWVDDAPWGFAPFHYGRWANARGGWVWIPGASPARPVYAPALVAFVGGGGFGIGAVAWFPLGPQEVYRPVYRVSPDYVRNVNVRNVTNVTNITNVNVNVTNVRYVNQNVQGAVTAVPQNAFVSARPVSSAATRLSAQQLASAQVQPGAQVAPVRASMMSYAGDARPVARPREAVMTREVVAKSAPPPPPVSFQARQAMLTQNQGRPLAPEQVMQVRQQQPEAAVNRAPVRVAGQGQQGRRAGIPVQAERPENSNPPRNFESRNPNDFRRPATAVPAPPPAPVPGQAPAPEQVRPLGERRAAPEYRQAPQAAPAPAPMPAQVPAPQQARPFPERRAAPENRPAPQAAPAPAQVPAQVRPVPAPQAPARPAQQRPPERNGNRREEDRDKEKR